MRHAIATGLLVAALAGSATIGWAQAPSIVRDVRTAVNCTTWPCSPVQDFAPAEAMLERYRQQNGETSQTIEALSWLGRAALAGKQVDRALDYARDTYDRALDRLGRRPLRDDSSLEAALGAAIEVQAQARAAKGQRSEAVYFLSRELDTFRDSPLHKRIQKNIHLLSLEGQPAPALEVRDTLGSPVTLASLKGRVVLLFFWAHWCGDCKAQSPIVERLLARYTDRGLVVVAPTQYYGYVKAGQPAAPEEERRHIVQVRDTYYRFLQNAAVPVGEANHKAYGVSSTPTIALVDKAGVVRLYHPGTIDERALDAAILPLLTTSATR
jgi:thiol-disulfide isomerase/thioredoxin